MIPAVIQKKHAICTLMFMLCIAFCTRALEAPTFLITFITGDSLLDVEVTWTDNADNEEGYAVERKVGEEGEWAELNRTQADAGSYLDTGLLIGTTYYYRVRAFSGTEYSDYSNEDYADISGVPYIYMTQPVYDAEAQNQLTVNSTVRVKWEANKVSEVRIMVLDSLGLNPAEFNNGPVSTTNEDWNNFPLTIPDSLLNRDIYIQVREYNDIVWDTQGPFTVVAESGVRPFLKPARELDGISVDHNEPVQPVLFAVDGKRLSSRFSIHGIVITSTKGRVQRMAVPVRETR